MIYLVKLSPHQERLSHHNVNGHGTMHTKTQERAKNIIKNTTIAFYNKQIISDYIKELYLAMDMLGMGL